MPYQYYPQYGMQYTQPMPDQLTQLRQQQYQQPLMQQPMQQAQPAQQPSNSIIWVQNQQEAFNYMVAPNCAVALWDSNSPVIYLKQADASGKPTIKIYDLIERTQQRHQTPTQSFDQYVTRKEFDDLQARFEVLASQSHPAKKSSEKGDAVNA